MQKMKTIAITKGHSISSRKASGGPSKRDCGVKTGLYLEFTLSQALCDHCETEPKAAFVCAARNCSISAEKVPLLLRQIARKNPAQGQG
jgi:hypothetical protein